MVLGMDIGLWKLHRPDERPGSLFEEHPHDYASRALVVGRSRRVCVKCSSWCWVPLEKGGESLLEMGWCLIGREWYCTDCIPSDREVPTPDEIKERLKTPAHMRPVATFSGMADKDSNASNP